MDRVVKNSANSANERLREIIEGSPLSISEIAKRASIPRRTLYDAFKPGHDFRISLLEELSKHIPIDHEYILSGERKSLHDEGGNANEPTVPFQGETLDASILKDFVFIPHYNIKTESGDDKMIEDIEPRPFPIWRNWIDHDLHNNLSDLMLIRVTGDSMYPTLQNSDTILVDRSRNKPVGDAIYLIRLNDIYRIKRIQIISASKMLLISDNSLYDNITTDIKDESIEITGKVIWKAGKL